MQSPSVLKRSSVFTLSSCCEKVSQLLEASYIFNLKKCNFCESTNATIKQKTFPRGRATTMKEDLHCQTV